MSDATGSTTGGQATSTSAALAGLADTSTTQAATTTTAATTTAASTTQATTTPATSLSWLPDADEVTVGYVANKGWTEPKQVLEGYRNLEKLLGADKAGNAIVIPKADADPKEWQAVFDRLGRPTGPDGYKVPVPEGGDAQFQNLALAKAHELGLTKAQAEGLFGWYNEQGANVQKATMEAKMAEFGRQDAALKAEWGQAYTQELAKAQVGQRALALDAASVDKIADALGHQATMKLLARVGAGLAEDDFATGDTPAGFAQAMTPGQAQAKLAELKADREWSKKYLSGDVAAKAEMTRLMKFAYPDQ